MTQDTFQNIPDLQREPAQRRREPARGFSFFAAQGQFPRIRDVIVLGFVPIAAGGGRAMAFQGRRDRENAARRRPWKTIVRVLGLVTVWGAVSAPAALAEDDSDEFPSFGKVTAAAHGHFGDKPDWRPGDLISRTDAKEVFEILDRVGWTVKQRDSISKRVLADTAFLVQKLGSRAGKKFMRRVAKYPRVFDRLDRLSNMSGGRKLVSDLVLDKGGYELVEYLSTTRGGRNLGRMLKRSKNGSDLNRPTRKIYTARQLLEALREAYDEERAALEKETDDDGSEEEDSEDAEQ